MEKIRKGVRYILPAVLAIAVSVLFVLPREVFAGAIDLNREYREGISSRPLKEIAAGVYQQTRLLTADTARLEEGCYVVDGTVTVPHELKVNGSVYIFLNKGSVLNVPKGIQLVKNTFNDSSDASILSVYEEASGIGTINITSPASGKAGLGGDDDYDILIRSGTINAIGGKYAPGIGTNADTGGSKGNIYVYGGTINSYGGSEGGAGIGSGRGSWFERVVLLGGTINAVGNGGSGIGSGRATAASNNIGGTMVFEEGGRAAGNLTLYAAKLKIKAVGENGGYGIGGSKYGSYEHRLEWTNIHSGDITLRGNAGAAGSFKQMDNIDDLIGLFSQSWDVATFNHYYGYYAEFDSWADRFIDSNGYTSLVDYKDEDVRAGALRVTFSIHEAQGHYAIPPQWVKVGEKIKKPSFSMKGYTIDHWDCTAGVNNINFDTYTIDSYDPLQLNMVGYTKKTTDNGYCYMQYVLNDGTGTITTKSYKRGTNPSSISVSRKGYRFKYWKDYKGEDRAFDFNQALYSDTAVEAVWEYTGITGFSGSGLPNTDSSDSRFLIALIFALSAVGAGVSFTLRRW